MAWLKKLGIGILVVLVLAGILTLVNIKPILVGYATYNRFNRANQTPEKYDAEIKGLKLKLEGCLAAVEERGGELRQLREVLDKANAQAGEINKSLQRCQQKLESELKRINDKHGEELSKLKKELAAIKEQLRLAQKNFTKLAENSAIAICCAQKSGNPKINAYNVSRNTILCLERGAKPLKCPR